MKTYRPAAIQPLSKKKKGDARSHAVSQHGAGQEASPHIHIMFMDFSTSRPMSSINVEILIDYKIPSLGYFVVATENSPRYPSLSYLLGTQAVPETMGKKDAQVPALLGLED